MKTILLILFSYQSYSAAFEYDKFLFVTSNDDLGGTDTGKTFGFESYVKTHGIRLGIVYDSYTHGNPFDEDDFDWGPVYSRAPTEKENPLRNDKLRIVVDKPFHGITYGIGIDMVDNYYGAEIQNTWHNMISSSETIINYEDTSYMSGLAYIEYYKFNTIYQIDNFIYSKLLIGDMIEFDSQVSMVYKKEDMRLWIGVGYEWYSEGRSKVINEAAERLQGLKLVLGCQVNSLIMSVDIHDNNAWGSIGFCW